MMKLRMDNEQSPTRLIRTILRSYWQGKRLDDQDWALICACLDKVERVCPFCKERCRNNATDT